MKLALLSRAVPTGILFALLATAQTQGATAAIDKSNNNTVMGNLTNPSAYATYLPSQEPGHVEIRTISGRLLESRAIPAGASEAFLGFPTGDGIYLARVVQGESIHTAKLFQPSR